jgi:hypothetical protein
MTRLLGPAVIAVATASLAGPAMTPTPAMAQTTVASSGGAGAASTAPARARPVDPGMAGKQMGRAGGTIGTGSSSATGGGDTGVLGNGPGQQSATHFGPGPGAGGRAAAASGVTPPASEPQQ